MTITTRMAALAAATLLAFGAPAWAQTPQDPHHPDQTVAPAPKRPAAKRPAATAPAPAAPASSEAMMQGCGAMMGMMMGMMRQAGADMSGAAMPGMATGEHIEGRLAFLRTELKIADGQAAAWNDFAAALRASAKTAGAAHAATAEPRAALTERLSREEAWHAARLESVRSLKGAVSALYGVLTEDQRELADRLVGPHLGLAPMGGRMGSMSMMGMPTGSTGKDENTGKGAKP